MFLDRMEETQPCDSGVCISPRGEVSSSRNRAIVGVSRKLAVLLHRIWVTQEPYVPFYAAAA